MISMKKFFVVLLTACSSCSLVSAQELYPFTDPASNIPARSLTAKLGLRLADPVSASRMRQRFTPELMAGINKQLMLKVSTGFSDYYQSGLQWESVKGYLKWRFYSKDGIHRHFRMAAFVDGAYSRNPLRYDEMNLDGDNSGIQAGWVGTQLIHKLAISGTVSAMRIFDPRFSQSQQNISMDQDAFNYSLSAGYLVFPRSYENYQQINLNIYLELLGMKGLEAGRYYLDLAPALQLILNSATKINLGIRTEIAGSAYRLADRNYFISVESSFLNVFGKKQR
jgi:hypothetical protein